MSQNLVERSESRDYSDLFLLDLNWGAPDQGEVVLEVDGETYTATNVSSYQGLRVWEIPHLPGSAAEARLDQLLAKTTTNRIVIFHDEEKQAWRWPSRTTRGASVSSRPARHVHRTGSNDPKFAAKLDAIFLPDDIVLDANQVLAKVRGAFDVETKNESKRASKLMARMYTAVEKAYPAGYDPKKRDHEISVSLARILFLLFGDDTEMWATELFQDFVKDHTSRDGSDIGPKLNELFGALDTPSDSRKGDAAELSVFPYVNGGIFDERIVLPDLDEDFRNAVLDAAAVDWSTISPAIFGSMFQSVRDAQTRRELGEHYTSEENILKTLNPLFLDELRAEYEAALARDTGKKKANALNALWKRLGAIRYMDPACGCGNFIIVAYRELRAIELDIMLALQELSGYSQLSFDPTLDLKVTLDHFYGIEIDEWPARIAETAMFLIDRQCDLRLKERFGDAPQRLPIQREATIVVGNALRMNWEELGPSEGRIIVAGNPPFVGARRRTSDQTLDLQHVWGATRSGDFDYVTGWYKRAIEYLKDRQGDFALVSTNSVCQGQVVPPVFQWIFMAGWSISFAHRTFRWTSEAPGEASVHCVIVGLSRDSAPSRRLFSYQDVDGPAVESQPKAINAYLIDGPEVLVPETRTRISPQLPPCDFGSMANDGRGRKGLIVTPEDVADVLADPVAAKYLRPFIQAKELISGAELWCLWLEDAPSSDIRVSQVLRERVERVRKHRASSSRAATRKLADTGHLFGERRQPQTAYLAIPRHFSAKRRYFTAARYPADVICGDANFSAPDPEGLLFSVISSSMFMAWQRLVGGYIKSDPRFSKEVSWNTFPLPRIEEGLRQAICRAGREVLDARELRPHASLEDHYPTAGLEPGLQAAHDQLDGVVDAAFGADSSLSTDLDRQRLLLFRYRDLTVGA